VRGSPLATLFYGSIGNQHRHIGVRAFIGQLL